MRRSFYITNHLRRRTLILRRRNDDLCRILLHYFFNYISLSLQLLFCFSSGLNLSYRHPHFDLFWTSHFFLKHEALNQLFFLFPIRILMCLLLHFFVGFMLLMWAVLFPYRMQQFLNRCKCRVLFNQSKRVLWSVLLHLLSLASPKWPRYPSTIIDIMRMLHCFRCWIVHEVFQDFYLSFIQTHISFFLDYIL